MGAAWGSSPAPLERAGTVPSRAGPIVGFSLRRWNGREPWPTRPGPHFLGRNGGKNPRGKRFFPLDSFSGGVVGGGCTSYGIPGLRPSQRKARNGPPTGWAGWERQGRYPLGEGRGTVWFPLSPPVNKPLLPPARAGGRAMRRWSWRPQARPIPTQPPSPFLHQRMGFQGRNLLLWCSFFPISSKK